MRLFCYALVLALTATAAQADPPIISGREKAALKVKLHAMMVDRLRDPGAAQTRDEFLSWSEHSDTPIASLCGMVNAKNAYGGYFGFARFIASADGMIILESDEKAFASIWPVWCVRPMR